MELNNGKSNGKTRQAVKSKYLESSKRRVLVLHNNCIFRRRISQSVLCF